MRILITGANRGIGLEFAGQYAAAGHEVIATCRAPSAARELAELSAAHPGLSVEQLDVTDPASIERLAAAVGTDRALDLLLNNAGNYGQTSGALADVRPDDWMEMVCVNTIGPVLVTRALLPALRLSARPVVVGLSSVKASIGRNHMGGSYQYRASKAGLNAVLRSLAVDLAGDGVCVIALSPGWVPRTTDGFGRGLSPDDRLRRARKFISEFGGRDVRVTQSYSVKSMLAVIERLTLADSGGFLDHEGGTLPW